MQEVEILIVDYSGDGEALLDRMKRFFRKIGAVNPMNDVLSKWSPIVIVLIGADDRRCRGNIEKDLQAFKQTPVVLITDNLDFNVLDDLNKTLAIRGFYESHEPIESLSRLCGDLIRESKWLKGASQFCEKFDD